MSDKWSALRKGWLDSKLMKGLVALGLAVITWFLIDKTIRFEIEIENVPVTILMDQGWAILERSSDTVDIRVKGSQEDILHLGVDNVQVVLDIRGNAVEGKRTILVEPKHVRVPRGALPVSIQPGNITLTLDREAEKLVPVKTDIKGKPSPGYEMEKVQYTPASVLVRGPRKQIKSIEEIRTTPIDVEGRVQSFQERTGLLPPSPTWEGRIDPEKVTVDIKIIEHSAQIIMDQVPVHALMNPGSAPAVDINPRYIKITLKGRFEVIDVLEEKRIRAYIDCSSLKPARYELPVQVHAPPRVTVESIDPPTVNLTLGTW